MFSSHELSVREVGQVVDAPKTAKAFTKRYQETPMTAAEKPQPRALLPLPTELADGLRLEGVFFRISLLKFAPNELVPPLQANPVNRTD
ncbi:MAG: hypothetical protein IGS48_07145 [Oscillatoriales cyanobacterium C42_A2020_001]|nr:hypothetical protein [Leptolyngbyaceae cyanobacterium C42_A2020_001]